MRAHPLNNKQDSLRHALNAAFRHASNRMLRASALAHTKNIQLLHAPVALINCHLRLNGAICA